MKVLLISAITEQVNMHVLPLGLACIAASAEKAGHDVQSLVFPVSGLAPHKVIGTAVADFSPDVIGISVRNIDDQNMAHPKFFLPEVRHILQCCRESSPSPIVLGGAGYSIFPQAALDYLGADFGIQGEGEHAFAALLACLGEKGDASGIPGVYLRSHAPSHPTRSFQNPSDLPLPLPDRHLPMPHCTEIPDLWVPFQSRRGCPMDCAYCSTATIEGHTLRGHNPVRAAATLSQYASAGWNQLYFVDNTFNLPGGYAAALCREIMRARLNLNWRCILYPWKVDDTLADAMAMAGCTELSLGFESGSRKILSQMNKRYTPEDVRRISQILTKHGIRQTGFLLFGGPGETMETVEESLDFADSLDLDAIQVTVGIRIYPHTRLAQTAVAEGILQPDDDLLFPRFYMVNGLEEPLRKRVADWAQPRPHCIM